MTLQPLYTDEREPSRPQIVLLVEDEPFVREATRKILESAGFEVLPAADAADALRVFEQANRRIDLVMTDLVLPDRDGQQLGQELCRRSPGVKVLVTSGYCQVGQAMGEPHSQTHFLAKPYSRKGLVEKIREIFAVAPLCHAAGQTG